MQSMNEYSGLTPTRLHELLGFAAVARRLSFARAARDIGCTPSVLSRRIASLERSLGGALFLRSTRQVSLTPLGEVLLDRYQLLDTALAELNAEVSGQRAEPAGTVRLHLPTSYGRRCVAPLLAGFQSSYPHIRLDVTLDDGYADLIATRQDVAIRIGQLMDSGLMTRGLRPIRRFLCAAPSYLASAQPLRHPRDLKQHRCLGFAPLAAGDLWTFGDGGNGKSRTSVRVEPVLRTNNAEVLRRLALDGAGVAMLSDFIAGDDLVSGRLDELLLEWPLPQPAVQLVWVAGAERARRVRVLIDYLVEMLGRRA